MPEACHADRLHSTSSSSGPVLPDPLSSRSDPLLAWPGPGAGAGPTPSSEPSPGASTDLSAGRLSFLRGVAAAESADLLDAYGHFRAARREWLAAGDDLGADRAVLSIAGVLLEMGELDQAATLVHETLARLEGLGMVREEQLRMQLLAVAHRHLGEVGRGRGDHDEAARLFAVAENFFEAVGDTTGLADVRLRAALALLERGLARRAASVLLHARRLFLAGHSTRGAALAAIHLARALATEGHVTGAVDVLARVEPSVADNPADSALLGLTRAFVLLRARLFEKAYRTAVAAEESLVRLGMMEQSAHAALLAAMAADRWGRRGVAQPRYQVAERLFRACGTRWMLHTTWLDKARRLADRGRPEGAAQLCRQVLAEAEVGTAPLLVARAHLLLADLEPDLGRAEQQLDAAAAAAAMLTLPELRVRLGLGRARWYRRRGDVPAAVQHLRSTLDLGRIHQSQAEVRGHGALQEMLAAGDQELVELLLDLDTGAARLEAWQRASAAKVALLERVAAAPLRNDAVLDEAQGPDVDLDRLLESLLSREPRSGGRTGELPRVPESPVLEYYLLGDDVIAFVVRDGHVDVRRLPGAAVTSRELLGSWRRECALVAAVAREDRTGAPPVPPRSRSLVQLEEVLVAPLADLLQHVDDGPLVVVGHRHLNDVPFEALPAGLLQAASPLGLVMTMGLATAGPGTVPGAGPEHDPGQDPGRDRGSGPGAVPVRGSNAGVLVLAVPDELAPGIAAEGEIISSVVADAEVHVGEAATAALLADRAPGKRIVHLACHGEFSSGDPLSSVLHIGDGPLSARRIMGLDLRGAVVVLSACEGGLHAGCLAEPLGLVWACLAAGARAVVAAGWSVDDAATAELMTHFYREIEAGRDARVALARARRRVATERPHPYFWAAFRYLAAPTHALVEGAAGEWSVDAEAAAPGLSPEVPSWMDQEATSTH